MNKKLNAIFILSFIFLISFAGGDGCLTNNDTENETPTQTDCSWNTDGTFSFDNVYLNYPENPPDMFVAHFPSNPITDFMEVTFYGGVLYVTSNGVNCAGSKQKKYENGDDFGFSWINGVPKPEHDVLGNVRIEIYSKVYWDDSSNEVQVYWDETFNAKDYNGPKSGIFNSLVIPASSGGTPSIPGGIKSIYLDGDMV